MKPRVIVLGGCGFIGRNLVDELVREDIAAEVRVVDKVPPQTAWLNVTHKASFDSQRVSFVSANLINIDACKAAFVRDDSEKWDWVINCAGETRPGQSDPVLQDGVVKLSLNCAQTAVSAGAGAYLEISSCMGNNKKIAHKETDSREPVLRISQHKSRVEDELLKINGIRRIILRPAIVYGPGDRNGITPLLILGSIYKRLGECMRLLWSRDVKSNTVHVRDVARAIVHLMKLSAPSELEVYHVVDEGNSTQGSIADVVGNLLKVEHSCYGTVLSALTKSDLESVAEDCNDKHLSPWAEMCAEDGVENTPLSPYLTAENLHKCHIHLDGSKLKATGFQYLVPKLNQQSLLEVLEEYIAMDLFPRSALS